MTAKRKAHRKPIGRCENPFCDDVATITLVNGAEKTRYCDSCLREAAGELVSDNDRVVFEWNDDHTICELA